MYSEKGRRARTALALRRHAGVLLLSGGLILGACSVGRSSQSSPTRTAAQGAPTQVARADSTAQQDLATAPAPVTGVPTARAVGPGQATSQPTVIAPEGTVAPSRIDRSKPAAVVNGEPITFAELDTSLEQQYGSQAVERLITEKLIEQEARRRKVSATEREVDAELQRARGTLPPGQDFEQAVEQQFGSLQAFRDNLRLNILVQKLLAPRVRITEQQLQQFYNQNKQAFATPEQLRLSRVVADTQAQAAAAAKELRAGAKLQAVVAKHGSKQPARARQSADLGFLPAQSLPEELALAASGLQRGQVSEPIQLPDGGFAVVRLEARRGGQAPPLPQVRERVRESVRDQQIQQLVGPFLQELRVRAKVTTQFPAPPPQPGP